MGVKAIVWEKARLNADRNIVFLLVGLVLVTRLPFRTIMLYNWDSANFALALQHFDVTKHFPHPPGYFYYVHLAKLINFGVHDANASFVAESIIFSALAVVALYYLGKAMFDRATGFVAALLLVFSVTFWSYGLVALPYVSLAFFSTTAALFAYQIIFEKKDRLLPLSLVYTIGGGFRPDLLLFLAPLWLLSLRRQRFGRVVIAFLVVVAGFLLWFVPTVWLSGGIEQYYAVFTAYTSVDVMQKYSVMQNGTTALLVNVRDTLSYLFYALYATTLILIIAFASRMLKGQGWTRQGLFILGWIVPMALFYTWVHIGDPGYVFTILPALLVLAARSITAIDFVGIMPRFDLSFSNRQNGMRIVPVLVTTAIILANIAIYLMHQRPMTLAGIRQADQAVADKISYIRANYAPGSALLISYDLYRHLMYYLPEYDSLWLDVYASGQGERLLPVGAQRIILVDERLAGLAEGAQEIDLQHGKLYSLPANLGEKVVYGSDRVVVK